MTLMPQTLIHHNQTRTDDAREYQIRVRHRVFLWGSAGIGVDVKFSPPPVLHVWNDTFGEPIALGTRKANGAERALGELRPGEHFSIELHDISGVFAECHHESRVGCVIYR